MARMTKADMVQAVYGRLGGFSKKESADLVDLVFETMKETLGRGEKIKISGFGNFVLRDKRPRQGRNPQTGTPIMITERRVLSFKASQLLKHALNTSTHLEPAQIGAAAPIGVSEQAEAKTGEGHFQQRTPASPGGGSDPGSAGSLDVEPKKAGDGLALRSGELPPTSK